MSDAQTWTLIGGFFAMLIAMMGMVLRVVQLQIQSVSERLGGRIGSIESKLDLLDRDVQRLIEDRFRGT